MTAKNKLQKKELASTLSGALVKSIESIEHARLGRKLKKLVGKSTKKIASRIIEQIKRDDKRKQAVGKSLNALEGALGGEKKKKKKAKAEKAPK